MASTARIDELRKKFDENPRRYFAPLANEFRKAGDVEQAIMICEEFLPQQPGHMSGHIVYGQALFEASRFEESRTVFETALTLDPENLIALRHLGDIARGQGDLESARRWYLRVLDADPRNEEIQAVIAGLQDAPGGAPASAPAASAHAPPAEVSPYAPQPPAEHDVAPRPPLPELIDLDEHVTAAPAPAPEAAAPLPHPAEHAAVARAEGLESVEFMPPSGPVDRAHDLGASLEAGEFTAPAAPIAPLDGLEENSMGAFERSVPDGGPPLPMLDTSEPVQPLRQVEPREVAAEGAPTLEFTVPTAQERSAAGRPAETFERHAEVPGMPELEPMRGAPAESAGGVPAELPPAVIAAEAQLMDLGEPIGETPVAPSASPEPSLAAPSVPALSASPPRQAPFVTETMAELFVKQGFRDQALDVYRQLLAANPGDERLQRRIAELQPPAPAAAGDSVRDFLGRLAALRPGERAAAAAPPSDDDFASFGTTSPAAARATAAPSGETARPAEAAPAPAAPGHSGPSAQMSTGLERGAATQGSGGSIDALFGTRPAGTSEDSAASALAQAFGGSGEPSPAIAGRPARAAMGELSLDSVFRDAPPRPPRASQNFSFDQFFSPESSSADRGTPSAPQATSDPAAPSEPAERSSDDIEQFNSWLQGLKPK